MKKYSYFIEIHNLLFFSIVLSLSFLVGSCAPDSTVSNENQTRYLENETEILNGIKITASNGLPVTGIIYKNFENGHCKIEASYKNGMMDGLFKTWYESGNKEIVTEYIKGIPNGLWKKFYENGNLEMTLNYKDGIANGINKAWYENGQLKLESFLVNGKLSGLIKTWYESGRIRSEAMVENQNEIYRNCWDENGNVIVCN